MVSPESVAVTLGLSWKTPTLPPPLMVTPDAGPVIVSFALARSSVPPDRVIV